MVFCLKECLYERIVEIELRFNIFRDPTFLCYVELIILSVLSSLVYKLHIRILRILLYVVFYIYIVYLVQTEQYESAFKLQCLRQHGRMPI